MKMTKYVQFTAALAAVLVRLAASVFEQDSFTRVKRAAAQSTDRYGDLPLGAVIRTDDRYNQDGLFQGLRGWDYWNYLENPKPYHRIRTFGPTSGRRTFSAS